MGLTDRQAGRLDHAGKCVTASRHRKTYVWCEISTWRAGTIRFHEYPCADLHREGGRRDESPRPGRSREGGRSMG